MLAWEKQPIFGDATTGFPATWRLTNECRNSISMTRHYPDLGSASNWSCRVKNLIQLIRSTTQISVVTHHQYGISFLRRQFVGKPLVASPNIGCFLRLTWSHFKSIRKPEKARGQFRLVSALSCQMHITWTPSFREVKRALFDYGYYAIACQPVPERSKRTGNCWCGIGEKATERLIYVCFFNALWLVDLDMTIANTRTCS